MSWKIGDLYVNACHCGKPKHIAWANCNDCLRGCDYCRSTPGGFAVKQCLRCRKNMLGTPDVCPSCLEVSRRHDRSKFLMKFGYALIGPGMMGLNLGICGIRFSQWQYWLLFLSSLAWSLTAFYFGQAEARAKKDTSV